MIFTKSTISLTFGIIAATSQQVASEECTSIESITCTPTTTAPTLDGNSADWSTIDQFEAGLTSALPPNTPYKHSSAKIKCVYDADQIYFLFEIPGAHRFSTEDNHMCASISTMFKMGEDATLLDMGGCPLADAVNCEAAPEGCDPYKVDIGGHWELRTTEMGVFYEGNKATGDDAVANKDDEYAVGPYCRFDDNDAKAANEWSGAWLHTSPVEIERAASGEDGSYVFEMSRSLTTASEDTDAQLKAGTAIDFGFAFWDPYESEATGWSDAGHYVTGCSKDWISLRLVDENGELSEEDVAVPDAGDAAEVPVTSDGGDTVKDPVEDPTTNGGDTAEDPKIDGVETVEDPAEGSSSENAASFANGNLVFGMATLASAIAMNNFS